ncbi:prepilin peptidase [Parasphingorhabdus sp.]|uniref:prepilin peptidase n=1 Tax=Parasphingorhabdus sp. TaxID=2709688 RepID=UPI003001BF24
MPAFYLPLFGVLLGLIIGSFLATLIIRWPEQRSVIGGRSSCDACGHHLRPWELVPVASFLVQRGRCRQCGTAINADHVAIELAAGLIGGVALLAAPGMHGIGGALFGWLLLTLGALDAKHHWLPDRLTALLASCGLCAGLLSLPPSMSDRLIGGVAGFGALAIVAMAYRMIRKRDGLGGGDPKLFGAIGLWLGWQALPLVILGASAVGLLVAMSWFVRGKPVSAASMLPLGSLMAVSAFPLWIWQAGSGGLLY